MSNVAKRQNRFRDGNRSVTHEATWRSRSR